MLTFNNNISSLESNYLSPSEIDKNFQNFSTESFSVLHLNIRRMNKYFEAFQDFYKSLNTKFSIICLTETWTNDSDTNQNSLFQLEGYIPVHQIRKTRQGGGIVIFIRGSLLYKLRNDLSITWEDIESLSVEILNSQTRNIIFNVIYRSPNGDLNVFETFFKKILSDSTTVNKTFFLAGDFNINLLDFETNKKVQSFVNLMFEFSMIPTINKPTRVTKHTATAMDNVITNCSLNSDFKSAIVKTDLFDHFPIIFINELMRVPTPADDMENCVHKQDFTENAFNCFKQALFETSWDSVKNLKQPNEAYNNLEIFTELYEEYFPIRKIKIKPKRALSPWITNGIVKSSKRKQKLYEKFLKHRTPINEANYKAYKNPFETIKRKSKKRL